MKQFVIYDDLGRILRTGFCPTEDIALQAGVGEHASASQDPCTDESHYWDGNAFAPRPEAPTACNTDSLQADGVAEAVLSFPAGVAVKVAVVGPGTYSPFTVSDGRMEFSTDYPGTYTFYLDLFPYKNQTVVVNAI